MLTCFSFCSGAFCPVSTEHRHDDERRKKEAKHLRQIHKKIVLKKRSRKQAMDRMSEPRYFSGRRGGKGQSWAGWEWLNLSLISSSSSFIFICTIPKAEQKSTKFVSNCATHGSVPFVINTWLRASFVLGHHITPKDLCCKVRETLLLRKPPHN